MFSRSPLLEAVRERLLEDWGFFCDVLARFCFPAVFFSANIPHQFLYVSIFRYVAVRLRTKPEPVRRPPRRQRNAVLRFLFLF